MWKSETCPNGVSKEVFFAYFGISNSHLIGLRYGVIIDDILGETYTINQHGRYRSLTKHYLSHSPTLLERSWFVSNPQAHSSDRLSESPPRPITDGLDSRLLRSGQQSLWKRLDRRFRSTIALSKSSFASSELHRRSQYEEGDGDVIWSCSGLVVVVDLTPQASGAVVSSAPIVEIVEVVDLAFSFWLLQSLVDGVSAGLSGFGFLLFLFLLATLDAEPMIVLLIKL